MAKKRRRKKTSREELLHRRTFYVGDRVTLTQAASMVTTALLSTVFSMSGLVHGAIGLPTVALLVAAGAIALWMIVNRRKLYARSSWRLGAVLFILIWAPPASFLGAWLDVSRATEGAAGIVSLVVAVMNIAGYVLARYLRSTRPRRKGASRKVLIFLLVIGLAALGVLLGLPIMRSGYDSCGQPFSISGASNGQPALIGLYVLFVGVGAAISMGVNYYMLHCLYDPEGLDVEEHPPNELYVKMMLGSVIISGIAWTLLLLLIPPIAGGGGGGGKKSSSSSGSSRSSSSSSSHSGSGGAGLAGTKWALSAEQVRQRWAAVGLAEPR